VEGIGAYGNCCGFPRVGGALTCAEGYSQNHLFNAMCVGIIEHDKLTRAVASGAGNSVLLVGADTGRDGIHGATVSSGAMTSETAKEDAAHVQIGAPIEERNFMEAVPVARDAGCIRCSTDCGAAGLSSACGELGSLCGGVWVNLAWLQLKCASMAAWQKWLSESQERGVLAVPPAKLSEALEIFERFGVRTLVIGVFTDTGRCQVVDDPDLDFNSWLASPQPMFRSEVGVVYLPYSFLDEASPLHTIEVQRPTNFPAPFAMIAPYDAGEWG